MIARFICTDVRWVLVTHPRANFPLLAWPHRASEGGGREEAQVLLPYERAREGGRDPQVSGGGSY